MRLIEALREEHRLIEQVVGSLRAFVESRVRGDADVGDGDGFLRFFRTLVGGYHHAREEDVLFVALTGEAGLPRDEGPIPSFRAQHHEMGETLDEMAPLLAGELPPGAGAPLVALATRYAHALLRHIDAENTVLFPESEKRLEMSGIPELPEREPTMAEASAMVEGMRLVNRYPPRYDAEAIRGEGCIICPSLGTSCRGVEREWWNDSEWDEFSNRIS